MESSKEKKATSRGWRVVSWSEIRLRSEIEVRNL